MHLLFHSYLQRVITTKKTLGRFFFLNINVFKYTNNPIQINGNLFLTNFSKRKLFTHFFLLRQKSKTEEQNSSRWWIWWGNQIKSSRETFCFWQGLVLCSKIKSQILFISENNSHLSWHLRKKKCQNRWGVRIVSPSFFFFYYAS